MTTQTSLRVTFDELMHHTRWLLEPGRTPQDVRELVNDLIDNAKEYEAMASKAMSVADLKRSIMFPRGKKADMVEQLISAKAQSFAMIEMLSYSYGPGAWETAIREGLEKTCEPEAFRNAIAELAAEVEALKAKHVAKLAGINDPKTVEDFRNILRVKGDDALTPEQNIAFDRLLTEANQKERAASLERSSRRYSIDLEGVAFDLIDTKHTQKGHDLFVIQFTEWLPRRLWLKVYERAQEFGGWYSSYDANGAIPGLQFSTDKQRTEYCESVLCGGMQLADRIAEVKKMATMRAGARLRYLAESMLSDVGASLEHSREMKSNTPRRAAMQANAVERANARAALAQTMQNVAAVIENDEHHILAGIRYRTDFDTLRRVGMNYPVYNVERDIAASLCQKCGPAEAKLAATMIGKRLRETEGDVIPFNDKIVEQLMNKGVDAWWLFDKYTHRSRLSRMGLAMGYELRTAQRALAALTVAPAEEADATRLERELVGMNIPGFFPTPEALIRAMCEIANVGPTDHVLDPSCGKGDILGYAVENCNVASARGIEINSRLAKVCNAKGLAAVACEDTLEHPELYAGATVILMNPPFEQGQAVKHFQFAFDNAQHGTRIAAIMPASIASREDKLHSQFRDYMLGLGAEIHQNPPQSFAGAFRSTNVNTVLMYVVKP